MRKNWHLNAGNDYDEMRRLLFCHTANPHIDPSIAQLVERRTVVERYKADILRSLVRIRFEGIFRRIEILLIMKILQAHKRNNKGSKLDTQVQYILFSLVFDNFIHFMFFYLIF